jgi:hypothetical protein
MLSTSAFAMTPMGNVSNKGSLLIYSRIDVAGSNDTLVTLTNDSTGPVRLKCYYASSDDLGIAYTGTATSAKKYKHFLDFTIDLTHNQPIAFWAKSGQPAGFSQKVGGQVAPPFGIFPDGTIRTAGELKCWAVTDDGSTELHYNHLFGTASIMDFEFGQAAEYTAVAFQALGPSTLTGTPLGSPGELNLDNVEYDGGPNMLLGNFQPSGMIVETVSVGAAAKPVIGFDPATRVTLASLNQDLRQDYTPTITKLTWTFWNQDEQARTGTHWCANSWFETTLPYFQASYASLGTAAAYFRIETTADKSVCGPSAVTSSYVGNIEQWNGAGMYRGTNLTGRGQAKGVIKYDVSPPDSYKK